MRLLSHETAETSDVRIQISELRWFYLNSEFCILTSDVFAVQAFAATKTL
jgi:hypothetical protein